VEYEVTRGPKGLLAARVRRIEPEKKGKEGENHQPPKAPAAGP
jgi:hypothetical protein